MGTEALKSTPITNLDSIPATPNTTGEGAPGIVRTVSGIATATAGVTLGSTYRLVRLPTNAKVKSVKLTSVAQGGSAAADIDVAYSDSTIDGTAGSVQGNILQMSAADNKLFGSAVSLVSAITKQEQVYGNTTNFPLGSENTPLWSVLGLTQDPGGMFDILLKTTATLTNGGIVGVEVQYVD